MRAPKVGLGGRVGLVSREAALLGNNVLLMAAMGSVLLGTLYPLFLDALGLGKISVGPPYFDSVFAPLMTPVVFLMGVGPLARWKEASLPELAVRLRWAAAVSLVSAIAVPLIAGEWSALKSFGYLLAFWIFTASAVSVWDRVGRGAGGVWARLRQQPRAYWGMVLAHVGVGVFIVGVTTVKGYEVERDVRMDVGDTVSVGGYTFKFQGATQASGPNYRASRGSVEVSRGERFVETLHPEKRVYNTQQMPMTEAAIDTGPFGDIYVSLGEPVANGAWSVRVYYKPFVTWIWGGCLLMAFGGLLALLDRRYRRLARRQDEALAGASRAAA
jgi:cytochrome c-type biogenesis protein CcmF